MAKNRSRSAFWQDSRLPPYNEITSLALAERLRALERSGRIPSYKKVCKAAGVTRSEARLARWINHPKKNWRFLGEENYGRIAAYLILNRPSPRCALRDILHHIDLVARFAAGLGYEHFRNDDKTVYAVTRCLEIISEASRRLPAETKSRHPDISWQDMAGAGSVYRHDYDHVTARRLWRTLAHHLTPLRIVIVEELRRLGENL